MNLPPEFFEKKHKSYNEYKIDVIPSAITDVNNMTSSIGKNNIGGLYCDHGGCHAGIAGSSVNYDNNNKDNRNLINSRQMVFSPNVIGLVHGFKSDNTMFEKVYGKLYEEDVTQTNFGYNVKDYPIRSILWAPIIDDDVVKMQCCLGMQPPENCGEYGSNPDTFKEKCVDYYKYYCKKNKIFASDPNSYLSNVPELKKEAGCWVYNPMEKDRDGNKINDGNIRGDWYQVLTDKSTGTPINKLTCMEDVSRNLAEVNLRASTNGVVDTNWPLSYIPPIVIWNDEERKNDSAIIMNEKTTAHDKKYCGCDSDAVAAVNDELKQQWKDLVDKSRSGDVNALDALKPYCRIPTCGVQAATAIPHDVTQKPSTDQNKPCARKVQIVACQQEVSPLIGANSSIDVINNRQLCGSTNKTDISKDYFIILGGIVSPTDNYDDVSIRVEKLFKSFFKDNYGLDKVKFSGIYISPSGDILRATATGSAEDMKMVDGLQDEVKRYIISNILTKADMTDKNGSSMDTTIRVLLIISALVVVLLMVTFFVKRKQNIARYNEFYKNSLANQNKN